MDRPRPPTVSAHARMELPRAPRSVDDGRGRGRMCVRFVRGGGEMCVRFVRERGRDVRPICTGTRGGGPGRGNGSSGGARAPHVGRLDPHPLAERHDPWSRPGQHRATQSRPSQYRATQSRPVNAGGGGGRQCVPPGLVNPTPHATHPRNLLLTTAPRVPPPPPPPVLTGHVSSFPPY